MGILETLTFDTLVLSFGAILIIITGIKWHIDPNCDFNLQDLLVNHRTKKLSLYKIGQFFALLVSTWILIHETRMGRITEFLFMGYMAVWSGSNLLSKYLDIKKNKEEKSDESTIVV